MMHIKHLKIKSFGSRSGLILNEFSKGVNIIYGPNEAGKTTTMEAVRAALLGFLDGRVSTRNRYELPNGQDRHIYLELETNDKQIWHLDRTEGKRGLKIVDGNNNSIPEALLAEAIHHADRDMYENIFAFSLKELSTLSSLDSAAIQDRLLGTALGAGAVSPAVALKIIEDRKNNIYKAKGKKCTVAVVRKKIQAASSEISKLRTLPKDYDVQIRELSEFRQAHEKTKTDKLETDKKIFSIRRLLDIREEWDALRIAETESSQLIHAAKIPSEALTNLDNLSHEIERTSTKLKEQEDVLSEIRIKKSGLSPRPVLDPYLPELETFISEGTAQQAFPMGLRNQQDALEEAERNAEQKQQTCGSKWTVEQTQKVSPDRALKQEVLTKIDVLREAERKHKIVESRLDDSKSRQEGLLFKLDELERKHKTLDSFSQVPVDAITLVAGQEIQLEEIKKEEHRNRYEFKHQLQAVKEIEVDINLAEMRPKLERSRAELSAVSDLSERVVVGKDTIHDLEENLADIFLKCGESVTEDIVRKAGKNDFWTDQLTDWQEKWSESQISIKTSSTHVTDLKERLQSDRLTLKKDYVGPLFSNDQSESPDNYNKIIQEQRNSCRQFEKRIHILADNQETVEELKLEQLEINEEINTSIRRLGSDWEKEQVREHAVNQAMLQSAQQWSAKIQTEENVLSQIQEDVEEIQKNYNDAHYEYEKAQSASNAESGISETAAFDLINPLRKWLDICHNIDTLTVQLKTLHELQQESTNDSNQFDKQSSIIKIIMAVAGLTSTAAAGLLIFIGDLLYPGITVGAAGLCIVGILWFIRRGIMQSVTVAENNKSTKRAEISREINETKGKLHHSEEKLAEISKSLPDDISRTPDEIEKIIANLQSSMNKFLLHRQDLDRIKRLQDQAAMLEKNLGQRSTKEKDNTRQLASTHKEWENWLASLSGSFSGTPDEVISLMNELRDVQDVIYKEDALLAKIKSIHESIQQEKIAILEMAKKYELTISLNDDFAEMLTVWENRINKLEEFRSATIRVRSLQTEIVTAQNKLQEEETRSANLSGDWQAWLQDEGLPLLDNPAKGRSLQGHLRGAFDILTKRDQLEKEIKKAEVRFASLKTDTSDTFGIVTTNVQSVSQLISLVEEKYQQSITATDNVHKQKELQKDAVDAEKRADNAHQRLKEKENELQQMVQEFGFLSVTDFHDSKEKLAQYEALQQEINRLTPELEIVEKHIVTLEREGSEATDMVKGYLSTLKEVMLRHHLPTDIEPAVLPDFIDALIEHAKSINTLLECKNSNQKTRERWTKMTGRYSGLLKIFSYSIDFETMEPEMVVGNIRAAVQKLKDEDTQRQKYAELTRTEDIAAKMAAQVKAEYEERVAASDQILQSAKAPDINTFKKWAHDAERLRALQQIINEKEAILLTALNIAERTRLRSYLETIDWGNEQIKLENLIEEQSHFEAELSRLDKQIGAGEQKRTDDEKKAELAYYRQAEASGIGQLEAAFMEWMEWEVASHLIAMARDRFEKERQPEVLKEASEYFRILTGGAWQGIRIRLGEKEMEAVQGNGKLMSIMNLSSGTAEPLYLAMRLALITDFGRSSLGAPPVLMDDILVNFDDHRAANAVTAIMKVSKNAQIILLTCHERTVQQFENTGGPVKLHDISRNN
jgi:uncharacterized protein YhaN